VKRILVEVLGEQYLMTGSALFSNKKVEAGVPNLTATIKVGKKDQKQEETYSISLQFTGAVEAHHNPEELRAFLNTILDRKVPHGSGKRPKLLCRLHHR